MRKVVILPAIMLILCMGCQRIQYRADFTPIMTLKKIQDAPEDFRYEEDVDFYWWGFSPTRKRFNLTRVAIDNGAPYGLTNLRIREEWTFVNGIYALITLGIYVPRNVIVSGVKVKPRSAVVKGEAK